MNNPNIKAEYRLTHTNSMPHPVKTIVRGSTKMYREKDYYKEIGYTLVSIEFRNRTTDAWQLTTITDAD